MTHLQKIQQITNIEKEYNKQKELLSLEIMNITRLYSNYNGEFLKELSRFTKEYEDNRKVKLGQLYNEISPKLATKNEENNRN